jgi:hypothetical protein
LNAAGSDGRARINLSLSHHLNVFQSALRSWNITLAGDGASGADAFTRP